jgi:hypothetical protein
MAGADRGGLIGLAAVIPNKRQTDVCQVYSDSTPSSFLFSRKQQLKESQRVMRQKRASNNLMMAASEGKAERYEREAAKGREHVTNSTTWSGKIKGKIGVSFEGRY